MARFAAHAKRLLALQRCLCSASPPGIAKLCRVANYRLGTIVIHAENGAVATKLRQLSARLGHEFEKSGVEVTEIRVRVQAQDGGRDRGASPIGNSLSAKSKSALTSLQTSLPESSPLRAPLEKLIRRSRES